MLFLQVVWEAGFGRYREKILQNSLRDRVDVHTLLRSGIDPGSRAEQLTVEDFIKISNLTANERE